MHNAYGMAYLANKGSVTLYPSNPYGMAKWIVMLIGVFLIALITLDWIFPVGNRATELGVENSNRLIPNAVRATILLAMVCYVALTGIDPGAYCFTPGRILFVFIAYMLLSIFFYNEEVSLRLFVLVKSLTWIVAAIAAYRLTLSGYLSTFRLRRFAGILILVASVYTIVFCLNPDHRIGQNADAYMLLWCIPLLLLSRPPWWAFSLSGLAAIALLTTVKRGAVLAFLASSFIYSIVYFHLSARKHKVRDFALVLLIVVILLAGLIWQWENFEYRFQKDLDRGQIGSGRFWVYQVVLSEWYNADFSNFVLGHGFYTVPEKLDRYGKKIYAHSDWLEILYDMGFPGVGLFICIHITIITGIMKAYRQQNPVTPAFAMAYCIFALRNIYSQCVIESSQTIYFGLLLGYATAIVNDNDASRCMEQIKHGYESQYYRVRPVIHSS